MIREQSKHIEIPLESAAAFIAAVEVAAAEGKEAFLSENMPVLQDLLDRIQRQVSSLASLQYRGCCVRDDFLASVPQPSPERPFATT
ncbi:MAG TPA: hypothetical protein VM695_03350 [Phycisphaerae bacterium]|nr:hypothetical protein [Phycisphaerae bacterium]